MNMNSRTLSLLYQRAHDIMRDVEGLLPQEAFDELLKFLFYKSCMEEREAANPLIFGSLSLKDPEAIREILSAELASRAPWSHVLWNDGGTKLSDQTLLEIQHLLSDVRLSQLPIDVHSTALRTFLSSDARKGLGIFLTPEDVARTMVEIIAPTEHDTILDPACGSGTFLLETIRSISAQRSKESTLTVYGVEKNPRVLFLADLNLGHQPGIIFQRICADSLRDFAQLKSPPLGLLPNSVDVILTNPPFGVSVPSDDGTLRLFDTDGAVSYHRHSKTPSEILFINLCLNLLRPGGRLGIVLPRSVMTNKIFAPQRCAIDQLGHLTHMIDLPPETFAQMGTQTTTVAAFFQKHSEPRSKDLSQVRVCHVTNVGFDATGRHREGNQLPALATRLASDNPTGTPNITIYTHLKSTETLQSAAGILFRRKNSHSGTPLREFIEMANTGQTPRRDTYTDEGTFILKVGNLTGRGIDWEPRARNFVPDTEGVRRSKNHSLMLRQGDILLTSSAHVSTYIAKKVDIIDNVPEEYAALTFVAEMIRVRPVSDVDPFVLLAVLRNPEVREALQVSVRGQTAHLNPEELLDVSVPWDLRFPNQNLQEIADLLREEAAMAFRLNAIAFRALRLLESASTASI